MPKGKNNVSNVERQLQALTDRVAAMQVKAKKPKSKSKKKSNSSMSVNAGIGSSRIKRRYPVMTVKAETASNKGNGSVSIDASEGLFGLDKLGAVFERSKWYAAKFWYKPAVGSTVGGMVSVGIDWDLASAATDRAGVSHYSPSFTCAVSADCEARPMVLPAAKLMSRNWLCHNDKTATPNSSVGSLVWAVEGDSADKGKVYGEIWVEYDVLFDGFTA